MLRPLRDTVRVSGGKTVERRVGPSIPRPGPSFMRGAVHTATDSYR